MWIFSRTIHNICKVIAQVRCIRYDILYIFNPGLTTRLLWFVIMDHVGDIGNINGCLTTTQWPLFDGMYTIDMNIIVHVYIPIIIPPESVALCTVTTETFDIVVEESLPTKLLMVLSQSSALEKIESQLLDRHKIWGKNGRKRERSRHRIMGEGSERGYCRLGLLSACAYYSWW